MGIIDKMTLSTIPTFLKELLSIFFSLLGCMGKVVQDAHILGGGTWSPGVCPSFPGNMGEDWTMGEGCPRFPHFGGSILSNVL